MAPKKGWSNTGCKSDKKQLVTAPVISDNFVTKGVVFAAQHGYFESRSWNFPLRRESIITQPLSRS